MTDEQFEEWAQTLVIRGEQAWAPWEDGFEEAAALPPKKILTLEQRKHYSRDWNRRRRQDPEYLQREAARTLARRRRAGVAPRRYRNLIRPGR